MAEGTNSVQYSGMSVNHYDISNFAILRETYPNFLNQLQFALKGQQFVVLDRNSKAIPVSFEKHPGKFLENNSVDIILHKPKEQSWLKAQAKDWNILIKSLKSQYFCVIFSDEDFSQTYVCSKPTESMSVFAKISEFLKQNPTDHKISPHMREFIQHNEKFSDLKLEETPENGIWIRNLKEKSRLALEEEIKNVTCQGYLLDGDKFELLCDVKQEILSNIEKTFNVKGEIFSAVVPLVVEVNPQTSISCILKDQGGNFPVDNLIILDHQKPSDDYILELDRHKYKIWHKVPFDIPANQILFAEISSNCPESKLSDILEDCLPRIYDSTFPVTVLGIQLCSEFIKDWKNVFESLMSIVDHLEREQIKIPNHYIILIIENVEILAEIKHLFGKKIPLAQGGEKDFNLTVIEGDLAEEKVDIVVNSTNQQLDLNHGGISKALLAKAGPEIQNECKRKYPNGLDKTGLAVTKGYGLSCDYVIHSALAHFYQKSSVSELIQKCLQKAVDSHVSSIAFPALGTGNLNYPIDKVAEEMKESFETFSKTHINHGLKEIKIVLFPKQPEVKKLFSNLFENEMVPLNPSSNTEEKWLISCVEKTLHWIIFVNYSNMQQNLKLVLGKFQENLEKVPFTINSADLEQLLFFSNIFEIVPDIIEQYSEEKEGTTKLLIKRENLAKLQDLLKDTLNKIITDHLTLKVKLTKKQVEILLQKIQQEHPKVKCQILDNGKSFSFQSLSKENNMKVKCVLKSLLMSFSSAFSKKQFSLDVQEREENSSYLELMNVQPVGSNLEDTTCFKIANDFLIKVYEEDILKTNVDGIVNIIDNSVSYGGKIAEAIFRAAGVAVQREFRVKNKDKAYLEGFSTSAGNLNQYKNIIHVLEPSYSVKYSNDLYKRKISESVSNSLMQANLLGLHSVVLPPINLEILKLQPDICTDGYFRGVMEFLKVKKPNSQLKEVHFVDKNPDICSLIRDKFAKLLNGASKESIENYIHEGKGIYPAIPDEKTIENMEVDPVYEQNTKCLACGKTGSIILDQKKCQHFLCATCMKKKCPFCDIYAGPHPRGTMTVSEETIYPKTRVFQIIYKFDRLFEKGQEVYPFRYRACLPFTEEGATILKMLQLAFEQYLIFKVVNKSLVWNDIPHQSCDQTRLNGVLDQKFLKIVVDKLAEKGIVPEYVADKQIQHHITLEQRMI